MRVKKKSLLRKNKILSSGAEELNRNVLFTAFEADPDHLKAMGSVTNTNTTNINSIGRINLNNGITTANSTTGIANTDRLLVLLIQLILHFGAQPVHEMNNSTVSLHIAAK